MVVTKIQMPIAATASLLLFVGNWYLTENPFFSPAGILWSVSIEEQFYLVAPWLMKIKANAVLTAMVLILVLATTVRFVLLRNGKFDAIWFNTFTRLDPIAAGVILALLLKGRAPKMHTSVRALFAMAGITMLCVAAIVWHGAHPMNIVDGIASFPAAAIGVVCIFIAFLGAGNRMASSALSWQNFIWTVCIPPADTQYQQGGFDQINWGMSVVFARSNCASYHDSACCHFIPLFGISLLAKKEIRSVVRK